MPAGYTYSTFTSGGPNDYFYGIANNTSINTGYTTTNSWPKPDNTHRVFGVWDVIGDHTGATNPLLGNTAADTVASANGLAYMPAHQRGLPNRLGLSQTISNLCPNTYYEISIWMRNICSKCGCDVNGIGAQSAGYIPTAAGDSSGVYPNLSFNVNGIDYYTTGNLTYTGNWVKKGFTFSYRPFANQLYAEGVQQRTRRRRQRLGPGRYFSGHLQPNLAFTPNDNPTVCNGNVVDVGAYVRSYFNNYVYFKWQKSTDNGLTWIDTVSSGTGSPTWNGTAYEYYTAFPQFLANQSDSDEFRVVVASTLSNISSPGCSFADVSSVLTLNVIDCGVPLQTDIISFSGTLQGAAVSELDHQPRGRGGSVCGGAQHGRAQLQHRGHRAGQWRQRTGKLLQLDRSRTRGAGLLPHTPHHPRAPEAVKGPSGWHVDDAGTVAAGCEPGRSSRPSGTSAAPHRRSRPSRRCRRTRSSAWPGPPSWCRAACARRGRG